MSLSTGQVTLKKAIQFLLDRVPGYHIDWASVSSKSSSLKRSDASQSNPVTDELHAGVAFINQNAPDCDAENQQYVWISRKSRQSQVRPLRVGLKQRSVRWRIIRHEGMRMRVLPSSFRSPRRVSSCSWRTSYCLSCTHCS